MTRNLALHLCALLALLLPSVLGEVTVERGAPIVVAAVVAFVADDAGAAEHRGCQEAGHSQTHHQPPGVLAGETDRCVTRPTDLALSPPGDDRRDGLSYAPEPSPPKPLLHTA